jgi:hypothetical protein
MYPDEHLQVFGEVQFPREEQTVESEEFLPKQIFNSQTDPVYPLEQLQLFGEVQFPREEQTDEFDASLPKQTGY